MGDRIVGFGGAGEWAQRCAVGQIAVLPVKVDFAAGVAVPVAGVTALRALRVLEPIVGQRILITGASGGVGRSEWVRLRFATVMATGFYTLIWQRRQCIFEPMLLW